MDVFWPQGQGVHKFENAPYLGAVSIAFDLCGAMVERPVGQCLGHQWDANVWLAAPQELILATIFFFLITSRVV